MKASFNNKYFALNENMKTNETDKTMKEITSITDVIYPLYMPTNTHLASQDKVAKNDGERVILTFEGENPFMLIEETTSYQEDSLVIPTFGEPEILVDTVGAVSDSSANWISNGIEYYLVSDVLDKNQLIEVAKSISILPTIK